MMMSTQTYRAFGIATPLVTAAVLLFGKSFGWEISTNLFSTGVTLAVVLGVVNALLALAIYKNRI